MIGNTLKENKMTMTRMRNKEIGIFLGVSFILPLICICLTQFVSCFQSGAFYLLLFGIEAASPSIAAILCIVWMKGKGGLKSFLKEKYLEHFSLKKSLVGFLIPFLLLTIAEMISLAVGVKKVPISLLSSRKIVIIAWALVAEELGWRGYLQERLENKVNEEWVSLGVGVIWFLWHYHFFIGGTMSVPILWFLLGCIVESYGYYQLTKWSKGNILPASLWHFSGNLFFNLYALGQNNDTTYAITTLQYGLCVLFYFYQKRINKRRKESREISRF